MDPTLLPAAVLAALSLTGEVVCDWPPEGEDEEPERRVHFEAQATICLSAIDIEDIVIVPVLQRPPTRPPLLQLRDDFDDHMEEQRPTSFAPLAEPAQAPWPRGAPSPRLDAELEAQDPALSLPLDAARGLRLRRLRRAHREAAEQRSERSLTLRTLETEGRLPADVLAALRGGEGAEES